MPFRTTLVEIKRAALTRNITQLLSTRNTELMSRRLKDLQFLMQATAANSYNMQKQVVTGSLCYVVPKDIQPDHFHFKDHIKAVVLVACTCCTAFSLLSWCLNINARRVRRFQNLKLYHVSFHGSTTCPSFRAMQLKLASQACMRCRMTQSPFSTRERS